MVVRLKETELLFHPAFLYVSNSSQQHCFASAAAAYSRGSSCSSMQHLKNQTFISLQNTNINPAALLSQRLRFNPMGPSSKDPINPTYLLTEVASPMKLLFSLSCQMGNHSSNHSSCSIFSVKTTGLVSIMTVLKEDKDNTESA